MTYELIITEKPNAAKMIAQALADGKAIKESNNGVPYYKVTHGKNDLVIGCAVGHLYAVAEKNKSFNYPVFDLEWKSSADIDPKSFTKKYIDTLKKLAKGASSYTVATDYDIEGEVIGLNCVRFICKQKDAARMKFSTLTKPDIIDSYTHKSKSLDWGQALAGETRHYLDWMYGINLSRALTHAIKTSGMFKIMSSGRVQGPALKLLVDRENEIKAFVPENYWEIELRGCFEKSPQISFWHEKGKFSDEKEVIAIISRVKGKDGTLVRQQRSEFSQKPPVPFDLTTLQTEAYRVFGINPKQTLEIAQELYTGGYISYPRTSSQKLPKEIGFKKIITALSKNAAYSAVASMLLARELVPTEGKKTDPAHPAIYPTGTHPKVKDRQQKIYDLVVKRFFACFGEDAKRETVSFYVDVAKEGFIAKGTRTVVKGWHNLYAPYVNLEEEQLPSVKDGSRLAVSELKKHDKQTQPPKRYTPASIIRELEKHELGTKATRASIIDSLYNRNYIRDESITATELGIQTVQTLLKYAPEILDEELTRHFETEMDGVREKKFTEDAVLEDAKKTLTKILEKFRKNEKLIGKELNSSHRESLSSASMIGKCPNCKDGYLKIMYSKKTKRRFIACDKYPECKTILNMPYSKIQATDKLCEKCNYPIVKILAGRSSRTICLNPDCPTRATERAEQKRLEDMKKICPKCSKPLVLRRSVFGMFFGCSGFPKCRHIESIPKDASASSKNVSSSSKNVSSSSKNVSSSSKNVSSSSKNVSSNSNDSSLDSKYSSPAPKILSSNLKKSLSGSRSAVSSKIKKQSPSKKKKQ
jgi:DNA topoisomerase-1